MHLSLPLSQPRPRPRRRLVAAVSAAAVGALLTLASGTSPASASDIFGYGYTVPGDDGLGASHIGSYGPPGAPVPGVSGPVYCADPSLAGPVTALGYGPATTYTSWREADGTAISDGDVADAAYVLSQYGQTTSDSQAAATDAATASYLNPGTTYALPDGARALQRLSYANVPASVRTQASSIMTAAADDAGPYTVHIIAQGTLTAGRRTNFTYYVTSVSGHRLPGIRLDLSATSGSITDTASVTTNSAGVAPGFINPPAGHSVTITAHAATLPATSLRAVTPHNTAAQRLVLAGGTSSAQAQLTLPVAVPGGGRIEVEKTAADTHKAMAAVEFALVSGGRTVATGMTSASGIWESTGLPSGRYTVHEVQAAPGYRLAPDQTVTVQDGKTAVVDVTDQPIPAQPTPAPRHVPTGTLPQTGA